MTILSVPVDKCPGNKLLTGQIIWIRAHINLYKSFSVTYANSADPDQPLQTGNGQKPTGFCPSGLLSYTLQTWNLIRVSTVC